MLPILEEPHDGSFAIEESGQRRCKSQCAEPEADLRGLQARSGKNCMDPIGPARQLLYGKCALCKGGYIGYTFGDIPTDRILSQTRVPIIELTRNKKQYEAAMEPYKAIWQIPVLAGLLQQILPHKLMLGPRPEAPLPILQPTNNGHVRFYQMYDSLTHSLDRIHPADTPKVCFDLLIADRKLILCHLGQCCLGHTDG